MSLTIYIGKMSGDASFQANFSSVAEGIMMQLCSSFLNKGLNVTAENWFSSLPLVERLQERKTTYVGTTRANRRNIPPACIWQWRVKNAETLSFSIQRRHFALLILGQGLEACCSFGGLVRQSWRQYTRMCQTGNSQVL